MTTYETSNKLDYNKLPWNNKDHPTPREDLQKAANILSDLQDNFIPTWTKSKVELGTATVDGRLCVKLGVRKDVIKECQRIMDDRYKDSDIQVVVEEETLRYIQPLYDEIKPWWKFW